MSKIEEAVEFYWGERCPDHEAECVICQAWKEYDDLVALADRATWTSQKKYEHDLKLKKEQA
jgi:hypothetical protein